MFGSAVPAIGKILWSSVSFKRLFINQQDSFKVTLTYFMQNTELEVILLTSLKSKFSKNSAICYLIYMIHIGNIS